MATVEVGETTVTVRFHPLEEVLGLVRDVTLPRSAVRDVQLLDDGRTAVRGWRVGTWVPGLLLLGVWRSTGQRQLVAVRRSCPTLRVRLTGEKFDELLISDEHAAHHVQLLARPARGA